MPPPEVPRPRRPPRATLCPHLRALELREGGAGALELVGGQPDGGEDLAIAGRGPGPVRLAEGEDGVVAQVAHDPRVRDAIGLDVARPERGPRRAGDDLDQLE